MPVAFSFSSPYHRATLTPPSQKATLVSIQTTSHSAAHSSRLTSRLEGGLVVATLVLLFWLPLPYGSNRDWASSLLVVTSGLLMLLTVAAHIRVQPLSLLARFPKPALPPLLLLLAVQLWVFLQWLLGISTDPGATARYLLLGLSYSSLFCLILILFNTRQRLTLLIATLIVSGTLQAFYGAFMTLSGIEWLLFSAKDSYRGVVTGTFVNRNHLAGYLELVIPCAIGLMLALRDGKPFSWQGMAELLLSPKILLRLSIVIMVIALVMSQSRMGNTGFFTGLMIVGAIFVLRNKEHRLRNSLLLASLVAIDILVISQFFGLENLKNRLEQTHLETVIEDGRVVQRRADRLDVAEFVLPMIQERPHTGYGAGTFETAFPPYAEDLWGDFDHAHNDYLQFLVEFGWVGTAPLALFVLYSLSQALRALWRRESYYRSGIGFGASMAIIALMVHSLTDFNLQIPANAATFVTVCAIAILANTHQHRRRRSRR